MKRSLFFLLAAGPFLVFGQRLDQPRLLPLMVPDAFVRIMAPDAMACLVTVRVVERMPMSRHSNADPMPNAIRLKGGDNLSNPNRQPTPTAAAAAYNFATDAVDLLSIDCD
jgi:hypothetical protein